MGNALRGMRHIIALTGRCNTGKSTLLNLITGQQTVMVTPEPGTTADPVAKPFELLPLGPVTFYDTAGLDEASALGQLRRQASQSVLNKADMVLLITDTLTGIDAEEKEVVRQLASLETPFLIVFNKTDLAPLRALDSDYCLKRNIKYLAVSSQDADTGLILREALIRLAPSKLAPPPLALDLIPEKGLAICVAPIDAGAPQGRLIAPQVQVLRELIEFGRCVLVLQPEQLASALERLRDLPDLVITDSQAVGEVNKILPPEVPLTTFSLLFARQKGDFTLLLQGAAAISRLTSQSRILVAEACSHHQQSDDIARKKLPALLSRHTGYDLRFEYCAGGDFPPNLADYDLVLHCGGCMLNAREMKRRLKICKLNKVPVTNYGMAISLCQGILDRVRIKDNQ